MTFWPGNFIWVFSYGFGVVVRHLGEWRPGFYREFRCASREHSGLAWGAIFEKMSKFQEMHTLSKRTCPKFPEIDIFSGQKPRRELQDIKELFRIGKSKYKFLFFFTRDPFKKLPPQNKFIFLMKSQIVLFQKNDSLLFFTDQNHFFAENQNGPYGP